MALFVRASLVVGPVLIAAVLVCTLFVGSADSQNVQDVDAGDVEEQDATEAEASPDESSKSEPSDEVERPNPFRRESSGTAVEPGSDSAKSRRELLEEIQHNMERIESLLDDRKTDEGTQTLQQRAVDQIEELINLFGP